MERDIEWRLSAWKDKKRRKPLILRGARQVGKTYSLKKFGSAQFANLVYIDLERHPEWHGIFSGDLSPAKICLELEIVSGHKIIPGKTLLFLDEIQSCPPAIMALRYFYEEMPELHVATAGSLVEFVLKDLSFPVGRIQFLHLGPLSFQEYLLAAGHKQAAELLMEQPKQLSDTIHAFLSGELKKYFFVGGMPECVKVFLETGSMQEAFEVQEEICETYFLDFAKYKPRADKLCLHQVLAAVARNVGRQIKYSNLTDGFSNPTIKKAFDLLCLANLVYKVSSADPSGLPLQTSSTGKIFKAVLLDIGLMRYLNRMPMETEYLSKDLLHIYRGAMAEQFVGQELLAAGNGRPVFYWSRRAKSSTAEVDYLAVINSRIYPVEVKSGAGGRLKSLHLCLAGYKNCPKGLVFSDRPYQELPDQSLVFLPLYYAGNQSL